MNGSIDRSLSKLPAAYLVAAPDTNPLVQLPQALYFSACGPGGERQIRTRPEPAQMIIRKAAHDDVDAIAAIHVAAWQHTYRGILPDRLLDSLDRRERAKLWANWLESPDVQVYVAAGDNGDVLGFTAICPARPIAEPAENAIEITHVYVDARAQGEGVGTELLRQALAAAQGSPSVLLWVLEENHKARRFYEHFGFSLDGAVHSDPAFLGNDAREVRYQRSLGD